ncbi:hypothetical protein TH63_02780 [Rufibacter radiotolerans]|uniref:Imidazole glycerol phosphate synthase subunit HisH n=1 Tax=Rufibacter radiotolerans TaxID=1379910 RepID=A0A0H4VHK2_9BACT|nr:imidazole glycerol phosphate synthase subunit HisH [Rufibacter radiotolerans]AKQ44793.1 hypothetical protein TH63_02780 [Rufibacter radiotolerans]
MKKSIAIIDYGVGNIQSVKEAIGSLGYNLFVSNDTNKLAKADGLILPGVGAFGAAMESLHERRLIVPLNELVLEQKKPILGICLGMQLLADFSEENGYHNGLGWISGGVIRIEGGQNLRVPHVGWNDVDIRQKEPLFDRMQGTSNFYFDHSYHFDAKNEEDVAARVNYGLGLVAAVKRGNIHGVQFHPEKSQITGLRLLKGFLNSIG